MSEVCTYPGCGVVLRKSRYGLCVAHQHAMGLCACARCARRDALLRRLRSLAREGVTVKEAATAVRLDYSTVFRLARGAGIVFRKWHEPRAALVPVPKCCAVPQAPRAVRVDPLAAIYHPRWSPADDLLLLRDRAAGDWFAVIATDMDRGVAEVQQRWHRLRAVPGIEELIKDHVKAGADADAPWPDPSEVAA